LEFQSPSRRIFIGSHSLPPPLSGRLIGPSDVGYVTFTPWKLHFDGSACRSGCGVEIIIMSPSGAIFEAPSRLDHKCTNNQIEYEALLFDFKYYMTWE
jgi:hypothetical protein